MLILPPAPVQPVLDVHPVVEAAPLPIKVISIDALIRDSAEQEGISYDLFYKTLSCESAGFKDVAIQSGYKKADGTRENSWGLAQINLDAHPDISMASATDPTFAIPWAARLFKAHPTQFSCYALIS